MPRFVVGLVVDQLVGRVIAAQKIFSRAALVFLFLGLGVLVRLVLAGGRRGVFFPAAAAISGATRMTDKSRAADSARVGFMRPLLYVGVTIIHGRDALSCAAGIIERK